VSNLQNNKETVEYNTKEQYLNVDDVF